MEGEKKLFSYIDTGLVNTLKKIAKQAWPSLVMSILFKKVRKRGGGAYLLSWMGQMWGGGGGGGRWKGIIRGNEVFVILYI